MVLFMSNNDSKASVDKNFGYVTLMSAKLNLLQNQVLYIQEINV